LRAYYFVDENYGIENLEKKRLKVARIMELNDPFELLGLVLTDPITRKAMNMTKEQLNKEYGILCFSKSWKNPVQWSHYANNHKGLCLGFDVSDKHIKKVEYIKERIPYSGGDVSLTQMINILTSKFNHWEYEHEYRLFLSLQNKERNLYFSYFDEMIKLKEVIIGGSSIIKVTDITSLVDKDVEIFKARPAFKTFEIVQNIAIKKVRGKMKNSG
jgi:hypothetical protein